MHCNKQKDRLAAVSNQPGHSDRPVQEPRVKLAWTFAASAASSSTSSETSKKSISSCAFSEMSDITFILFLFCRAPLDCIRAHPIIRLFHGKVAMGIIY